jgi:uncharacterized protein (TIGR00730 family)
MSVQSLKLKSVCLYCGASDFVEPRYLEIAAQFGQLLAKSGLRLVYGGGGVGLMGAAALGAYQAGGEVLGIMPSFLRSRERLFDEVETRVVTSMHERKMMMFDESDAFVVMPGGIGTLEEAIELMSWRRLDLHQKPIVFLNLDGFWQPLFDLINHTIELRFTPPTFVQSFRQVNTIEALLPTIEAMLSQPITIDSR